MSARTPSRRLARALLAALPLLAAPVRAAEPAPAPAKAAAKGETEELKTLKAQVKLVETSLAEKKKRTAKSDEARKALVAEAKSVIERTGYTPDVELQTLLPKLTKNTQVALAPGAKDGTPVVMQGTGDAKDCVEQLGAVAKRLPGTVVTHLELGDGKWSATLARPPATHVDPFKPDLPDVILPPVDESSGPAAGELRKRIASVQVELELEAKREAVVKELEARREALKKAAADAAHADRVKQVAPAVAALFGGKEPLLTKGTIDFDGDTLKASGTEKDAARKPEAVKAALAKSFKVTSVDRAGDLKLVLARK